MESSSKHIKEELILDAEMFDDNDDESNVANTESDNDESNDDPLLEPMRTRSAENQNEKNSKDGYFRTEERFVWSAELSNDLIEWRCRNNDLFLANGNREDNYK